MPTVANKIYVVVATYNERQNVRPLIDAIMNLPIEANMIIVDDNSPDGTGEAIREAQKAYETGRIVLIERAGKLGYGSAFIEGFRHALKLDAGIVTSMDADFSHDPQSVPAMVAALDGADFAIGSRYVGGIRILNWSMRRLLLSTGANFYINTILRFGVSDCTSGFRAYRAAVLRSIEMERATARGYAFLVELLDMVYNRHFRIVEVPIVYTERKAGRSKMSRGVIFEAIFRPWHLLFKRISG